MVSLSVLLNQVCNSKNEKNETDFPRNQVYSIGLSPSILYRSFTHPTGNYYSFDNTRGMTEINLKKDTCFHQLHAHEIVFLDLDFKL